MADRGHVNKAIVVMAKLKALRRATRQQMHREVGGDKDYVNTLLDHIADEGLADKKHAERAPGQRGPVAYVYQWKED